MYPFRVRSLVKSHDSWRRVNDWGLVICSKDFRMAKHTFQSLSPADRDRVIQMAWEDRTSFDAIKDQFGLSPGEVIHLMRSELKRSSFRLWRERSVGRATKHVAKRGFEIGRFRCPDQRGD
jgi:uncharacterized protein (TIGR03643 family)